MGNIEASSTATVEFGASPVNRKFVPSARLSERSLPNCGGRITITVIRSAHFADEKKVILICSIAEL